MSDDSSRLPSATAEYHKSGLPATECRRFFVRRSGRLGRTTGAVTLAEFREKVRLILLSALEDLLRRAGSGDRCDGQ
jgi:hypothetical protein